MGRILTLWVKSDDPYRVELIGCQSTGGGACALPPATIDQPFRLSATMIDNSEAKELPGPHIIRQKGEEYKL